MKQPDRIRREDGDPQALAEGRMPSDAGLIERSRRSAPSRRITLGRRFLRFRWPRRVAAAVARPRGPFREAYQVEDNAHVVVHTADPSLCLDYPFRKALPQLGPGALRVSLIATVKDEVESVVPWVASLLGQSHLPDEVILVDGGSTDGTLERLRAFAAEAPFPVEVVSRPGVNIARGRNLAIQRAHHSLIAVTDFGCVLDPHWLEALLAPFQNDEAIEVSAGWYRPSHQGRILTGELWPDLRSTVPQSFLPSSRSIAFRVEAWRAAGGYPEWLTLTGEDTYFALELKKLCRRWAFVPDAVVDWEAPSSWRSYADKAYRWSVGDGESSIHGRYYWREFLETAAWALATILLAALGALGWLSGFLLPWVGASLWLLPSLAVLLVRLVGGHSPFSALPHFSAKIARVLGFLTGALRRRAADRRRWAGLDQVVFILAGVPIDDTGGGARGTQLALELLTRNCGVVFIHRFPRYETVDLRLQIVHPNLVTSSLSDFRWPAFDQDNHGLLDGKRLSAIVEFPLADFLPLLEALRLRQALLVYDCIDAWDTSLGAEWYSLETENEIIKTSDVLLATEASLKDRLEARTGRSVTLLPNAVNARLFDPDHPLPRPPDLPEGSRILVYHGALWGDWFDWDLLADILTDAPTDEVVLIGDYAGQCPFSPPDNLHFLGLKPQRSLPAYLQHSHAGFIPWKINEITLTTSPLKLYEYLSMRKPVVAPDLPPLRGVPGVFVSEDRQAFLDNLRRVRHLEVSRRDVDRFVRDNSWQVRIDLLLDQLEKARAGRTGQEPK
jgi:GT2 family glycosyltransferase